VLDKLEPKDKTPALVYGYYFQTFGIPFRIYKPDGLMSGTYKGEDLSKSDLFATRVLGKLRSIRFVQRFVYRYESLFSNKKKRILFFF
jgi:hypothetical protein